MALTAKNEMNAWDGTIFLKLYTQKNDEYDPYFVITNGDDKDKEIGEIVGNFLWINFEEYEYEDKWKTETAESIKIDLVDWEEKYQIQMGWTALSRAILNTLISEQPQHLKIRLYTNKGWYASAFIENNGQPMKWKYTMDELMEMTTKTKHENKTLIDWSKVKDKLRKDSVALNEDIKPPIKTETKETKVDSEPDEDLPF